MLTNWIYLFIFTWGELNSGWICYNSGYRVTRYFDFIITNVEVNTFNRYIVQYGEIYFGCINFFGNSVLIPSHRSFNEILWNSSEQFK